MKVFIILLLSLFSPVLVKTLGQAADLTVKLVHENSGGDWVKLEIVNKSDSDLYWDNYFVTKSGRLVGDIFEFSSDCDKPQYLGISVERTRPSIDSYVYLKKGGSYVASFNLSKEYKLVSGLEYKVRAKIDFGYFLSPIQADSLDRLRSVFLKSNEVITKP